MFIRGFFDDFSLLFRCFFVVFSMLFMMFQTDRMSLILLTVEFNSENLFPREFWCWTRLDIVLDRSSIWFRFPDKIWFNLFSFSRSNDLSSERSEIKKNPLFGDSLTQWFPTTVLRNTSVLQAGPKCSAKIFEISKFIQKKQVFWT